MTDRKLLHQYAKDLRHHATPAEQILWKYLSGKQLMGLKFRRQHVIQPYIVDFYCREKKLVIEVDGGTHLEQQEYDERREVYLKNKGFKIIRFINTDIKENISEVLKIIQNACEQ